MSDEVAVLGVGMHRFGIFPNVRAEEMARLAAEAALKDANMSFRDIDAVYVGFIGGSMMGAPKVAKELGLTGVPVQHIENASATGSTTFREAYLGISGGHYKTALCIGFDKMEEMPPVIGSVHSVESTLLPAAFFAMWAKRRMYDYGTTPQQLAWVAAKNWNNGALNPYAHRQPDHTITIDEVLHSYMVAEPFTAMMGAPVGGGAAAAVIGRKELADRYTPGRKVVTVAASALQSETYQPGHVFLGPVIGPSQMTADTAKEAYEQAGIGPEDVDIVEVHDAWAIEELEYYELLGFVPRGEGERLIDEEATTIRGRLPFNTDGGLIARGHPGGPTGLAQIHEITLQLRGEAGPRQVEGAKVGLAHMVGAGSVCCVHLLKV